MQCHALQCKASLSSSPLQLAGKDCYWKLPVLVLPKPFLTGFVHQCALLAQVPGPTVSRQWSRACRSEVVAWLASIGADKSVPTKKQTGLPSLSEEQWQQLQPKSAKAAIAAKEPAASQSKEPAVKAKEPASKPKDLSASKPKGRPRYHTLRIFDMCCVCRHHIVRRCEAY